MIPPVLHQTSKSRVLAEPIRSYSRSWTRLNPGLRHRFADDAESRALVAEFYPRYLAVYDAFPFGVQRADFFRYLAVYHFGGIYCDTDMECLQSFDRFLAMDGLILAIEARLTPQRQRELGYLRPLQIANCIFAAEPRHPFLLKVLERIVALCAMRPSQSLADVEDLTGPRMLTRLFYESPPAATVVLPQVYWMAPTYYARAPGLRRNVFACHHFAGSWKESGVRPSLSRRLIELNPPPWPFPGHLQSQIP